jgi:hypothetical protein
VQHLSDSGELFPQEKSFYAVVSPVWTIRRTHAYGLQRIAENDDFPSQLKVSLSVSSHLYG